MIWSEVRSNVIRRTVTGKCNDHDGGLVYFGISISTREHDPVHSLSGRTSARVLDDGRLGVKVGPLRIDRVPLFFACTGLFW